jgi:leucine dehydrogenase
MDLFETMREMQFGEVHTCVDEATGLQAVIAIHNTHLGPAIGGCRALHYASSDAAIVDAMRLARGMAYKAAAAGLPHGGGKAVIRLPDRPFDRDALFARYAEFVDQLQGRYLTCIDSGTSTADMDRIAKHTPHVLCTSASSNDPSPWTALGVRRGIEAAVRHRLGRDSLDGVHIAFQGVGSVGAKVVRQVVELGARVTIADVHGGAVDALASEVGAKVVPVESILEVECDVLAPCALGAVLTRHSIPRLRTSIIAGAANNVLATEADGLELYRRGILYAPDYVINAGGLMRVSLDLLDDAEAAERADALVSSLYDTLLAIFERSDREETATHRNANRIAEERMAAAAAAR